MVKRSQKDSWYLVEMATGAVPSSFSGLKMRESSLGFGKSVDFVRICDIKMIKSGRKRISMIQNSNTGPEIVELQPASEGIPLLETHLDDDMLTGSDKGADIVRITVQGKREADACFEIKNSLVQKNYNIPLVADIHFAPSVALREAECFDKIHVMNATDRLEYTEDDYEKELEHIEKVFTPLVEKWKEYGRAMRIGTNHGSLSDRIMSYYGDSPRGMVESAFEFARICRKLDFHNFVFSMKASNLVVMVQAYRLLVAEMYVQGWDYPLHLGVTEAGEGEDGRMKSAIGIGTLLQGEEVDYRGVLHRDGSVLMSVSLDQLKSNGLKMISESITVFIDLIFLRELPPVDDNDARLALKRLIEVSMGVIAPLSEQLTKPLPNAMVLVNLKELSTGAYKLLPEGTRLVVSLRGDEPSEEFEILKHVDAKMILHVLPLSEDKIGRVHAARRLFEYLAGKALSVPVIHHIQFPKGVRRDDLVIGAGTDMNTSFDLLQGCRMRNTKTEYVSCPSCGRTLFDVQEISAEIREKTTHLPGVSVITIMGCIVNGPGEMAGADFGYVGGAPGKIDLDVGKALQLILSRFILGYEDEFRVDMLTERFRKRWKSVELKWSMPLTPSSS
ncbi:hypothetical protein POTOM_016321 [Populus tomentosa]|uniref:4-hydroxy-3-methylbut-2-en-1-yl diphosphate synthase n=1 Tax=Populus tomentosa TaxID=118781 RepID=A0A8X8D6C4_POPTO|nr:hypothetical protein POTOM_016321 [Populus tomentosa]